MSARARPHLLALLQTLPLCPPSAYRVNLADGIDICDKLFQNRDGRKLMNERRKMAADSLLGSYHEEVAGDRVSSTFTGQGWIVGRYDDGNLLSSKTRDEYYQDPHEEKSLTTSDLFPDEWRGCQVEYEIIVRAKKISDRGS